MRKRIIKLTPYIILLITTIIIFLRVDFLMVDETSLFKIYNGQSFGELFPGGRTINILNLFISYLISISLMYSSIIYNSECNENIIAIIKYHSSSSIELKLIQLMYTLKKMLFIFIIYLLIIISIAMVSDVGINLTIIPIFIEIAILFLFFVLINIIAIFFMEKSRNIMMFYLISILIVNIMFGVYWQLQN